MDCHKLNETTYNAISDYMEHKALISQEKSLETNQIESVYSPVTLINDRHEDGRSASSLPPRPRPFVSEQMDAFRKPCKTILPDRQECYRSFFKNCGHGQELIADHLGMTYYQNYVTTYDLSFNHLTKGICGPFPRQYKKGRYLPEVDSTRIYKNLTQWGLKEKVYEEINAPLCRPFPPVSETRSEFDRISQDEIRKLNDFPPRRRKKSKW